MAKDNEAVRLSLIQNLTSAYPEFLGKLNAESVTNDLLAGRLAAVNEQYEKKIRIAQGEERIKRANDAFTGSIRQQASALQILARESGKSVVELEKLSKPQQIDLAKQVAQRNRTSSYQPNMMGVAQPTQMDYVVQVLEKSTAAQARAQRDLNEATAENAARQADLTKTTVDGYKAQIAQMQQKIKLHQIDKQLGAEEITRLNEQIRVTQNKPTKATVDTSQSGGGI